MQNHTYSLLVGCKAGGESLVSRNNVAAVRKSREMTQAELARAAGLDRAVLSLIEHGKRIPKLPLARRLAKVLKTDMDLLWPPGGLPDRIPAKR